MRRLTVGTNSQQLGGRRERTGTADFGDKSDIVPIHSRNTPSSTGETHTYNTVYFPGRKGLRWSLPKPTTRGGGKMTALDRPRYRLLSRICLSRTVGDDEGRI